MAADPYTIRPDLDFVREVKAQGGESVKKCFQCATCTSTCPIAPDAKPFPRKEMLWASWGLKDRLVSDPDIWMCYQCNDCSDICPRGSNPGDVIAAIRNQAFRYFAIPGFMGKALSSAKYLPLLFAFPIIILLAFMGATGHLNIPEGTVIYDKMLYHTEILHRHISGVDFIFVPFAGLMALMMLLSVARMWKAMDANQLIPKAATRKSIVQSVIEAVIEVLTHKQFGQCEANKPRFSAHLLVFYGFGALFVTTLLVMTGVYLFDKETPIRLLHPVKILANAGALVISIGLILVISNRMKATDAGKNNYYDWVFYLVLAGVVASGILSELLRLADIAVVAYPMYFAHLVFVFFLIVYLPYSKFAHMVYRFTAIVWAKKNGRDVAAAS
ncbi:MAG: quinone-interacting membrane-bound oxidoreductase complex subunit QmoC [bacterium]